MFPPSPNVSDVEISSDEEDAGQFKVPDADADEEEKIKKIVSILFTPFNVVNVE